LERIKEAMMRTSELLKKAVQDRRKVHEGMQKHAMRLGVFGTLDGGRQIKAHEDMVKPDTENRFKPQKGLTKPNMGMGDQGIPLEGSRKLQVKDSLSKPMNSHKNSSLRGNHEIHIRAATSAGNLPGTNPERNSLQTPGHLLQRQVTASRGPEYRTTDTGRESQGDPKFALGEEAEKSTGTGPRPRGAGSNPVIC
jgi:hypothetical protein